MKTIEQRFSLQGRVALVTGASSGFGAHFAAVLAQAGAKVAVAARRVDRIEEVVRGITERGGTAFACEIDVADRASINRAFDLIQEKLGVVDVAINNAGLSAPAPFPEMSEAQWASVLEVNLSGPYHVSQEMARRLIARKQPGTIVNIAADMCQQRVCSPADLETAVRLGLGYPQGPLAMGDLYGPTNMLEVLFNLQTVYGDPRYRPSPWLRRRGALGLSLLHEEE